MLATDHALLTTDFFRGDSFAFGRCLLGYFSTDYVLLKPTPWSAPRPLARRGYPSIDSLSLICDSVPVDLLFGSCFAGENYGLDMVGMVRARGIFSGFLVGRSCSPKNTTGLIEPILARNPRWSGLASNRGRSLLRQSA